MPTQTKFPTNWADNSGVGTISWATPGNAASDNNVTTGASLTAGATSHYLTGDTCGFDAFNAFATINSITVEVGRSKTGFGTVKDNRVRLIIGGAIDPTEKADTSTGWPASEGAKTYTWNTGLPTAAQILASNFGIAISCKETGAFDPAVGLVDYGSIQVDFTPVAAPAVSSVSANSGPASGGTNVTITGTGFSATPTVTFGGTSATNVAFVNSTTITCTTPAHAAGAVDVVVTNPDTQTGTGTNAFTYLPASASETQAVMPAPANVSPSSSCYSGFGSGSGFGI